MSNAVFQGVNRGCEKTRTAQGASLASGDQIVRGLANDRVARIKDNELCHRCASATAFIPVCDKLGLRVETCTDPVFGACRVGGNSAVVVTVRNAARARCRNACGLPVYGFELFGDCPTIPAAFSELGQVSARALAAFAPTIGVATASTYCGENPYKEKSLHLGSVCTGATRVKGGQVFR